MCFGLELFPSLEAKREAQVEKRQQPKSVVCGTSPVPGSATPKRWYTHVAHRARASSQNSACTHTLPAFCRQRAAAQSTLTGEFALQLSQHPPSTAKRGVQHSTRTMQRTAGGMPTCSMPKCSMQHCAGSMRMCTTSGSSMQHCAGSMRMCTTSGSSMQHSASSMHMCTMRHAPCTIRFGC
eukprot:358114-Chlamydomonas_euryale.AAC.4